MSLLPVASLPVGHIFYKMAIDVAGIIKIAHLGKRGVYLWTNQLNGNQYVASSINLSKRLADYFTPSYIKTQSERGSAICLAILKHGLDNFSIQVLELGLSQNRGGVKPTDDFIALPKGPEGEQYFLDRCILI